MHILKIKTYIYDFKSHTTKHDELQYKNMLKVIIKILKKLLIRYVKCYFCSKFVIEKGYFSIKM